MLGKSVFFCDNEKMLKIYISKVELFLPAIMSLSLRLHGVALVDGRSTCRPSFDDDDAFVSDDFWPDDDRELLELMTIACVAVDVSLKNEDHEGAFGFGAAAVLCGAPDAGGDDCPIAGHWLTSLSFKTAGSSGVKF